MDSILWIVGLIAASIASVVVMSVSGRTTYQNTGLRLAQAERCFLIACGLCARKARLDFQSLMLKLADKTNGGSHIADECLSDYANKYPQYAKMVPE